MGVLRQHFLGIADVESGSRISSSLLWSHGCHQATEVGRGYHPRVARETGLKSPRLDFSYN